MSQIAVHPVCEALGGGGEEEATCTSLRLLGRFAICQGPVERVPPAATQRVLALLALHGPELGRLHLAGTLWPEKTDERALANLRSALWRLDELGAALVVTDAATVTLRDDIVVDAREVADQWATLAQTELDLSGVLEVTRRFAAELLPGWYEDWVVFERERLRQIQLLGLEALSSTLCRSGRTAEAVLAGLAAVAREPLRESAHRVVIEAHLAAGNVVEARRQYQLCRSYLRDQLNVDPSPELSARLAGATAGATGDVTVEVPKIRRFGAGR